MKTRACLFVIGIGNSLRRDDGAGLVLARGLAEVWQAAGHCVELLTVHQLTPEIAEMAAGDDVAAVLFVDAAIAGGDGCRLGRVAAADASPSLGHQLGPAMVMLYTGQLFGRQPPAWLLEAPGHDFDHGEGLSAATAGAIAVQIAAAADLWPHLLPAA